MVAGTAVISNAEELFLYLQESFLKKQPPFEGCCHSLRSFFWVGEVDRDGTDRIAKTVKGTRSFHTVKGVA